MRNKYIFILSVSFICSILLSVMYTYYFDTIDSNEKFDIKKNILVCTSLSKNKILLLTEKEVENEYKDRIKELVIYVEGTEYKIMENLSIQDLKINDDPKSGKREYTLDNSSKGEYLPVYISMTDDKHENIIIPISGKGLWSTLFGYFAIDANNFNTVKAITFYKHKETPGLGGEVDALWFQNQFTDKNIFDDNNILKSISVIKNADLPSDKVVDAISGATITSNGLNNFLMRDLMRYEPFLLDNHIKNE